MAPAFGKPGRQHPLLTTVTTRPQLWETGAEVCPEEHFGKPGRSNTRYGCHWFFFCFNNSHNATATLGDRSGSVPSVEDHIGLCSEASRKEGRVLQQHMWPTVRANSQCLDTQSMPSSGSEHAFKFSLERQWRLERRLQAQPLLGFANMNRSQLADKARQLKIPITESHRRGHLIMLIRKNLMQQSTPEGSDSLGFGKHGVLDVSGGAEDGSGYCRWIDQVEDEQLHWKLKMFASWLRMQSVCQETNLENNMTQEQLTRTHQTSRRRETLRRIAGVEKLGEGRKIKVPIP